MAAGELAELNDVELTRQAAKRFPNVTVKKLAAKRPISEGKLQRRHWGFHFQNLLARSGRTPAEPCSSWRSVTGRTARPSRGRSNRPA